MTIEPTAQKRNALLNRSMMWVASICLPVALLIFPLWLLVTPTYVHWQYNRPGFPSSIRFDLPERARLSDTIVDYLRGKATRQEMAEMLTNGGEVAMRPDEVQHIVDVKGVMDWFFLAQPIASLLGVAACLWLAARRDYRSLVRTLRRVVIITLVIIGFIVAASLVDFDLFFDRFHRIFFTGNSWLFYYEDTLIQLYPLPFWVSAVLHMGIVIAAELALVLGLSFLALSRVKPERVSGKQN